jgi:glutaredoxin 2
LQLNTLTSKNSYIGDKKCLRTLYYLEKGGQMIDLFIDENCPYCKKVIEYFKENNIHFNKFDIKNKDNVLRLLSIGGKDQVPFLYNEDTNDKLYESEDIIEYVKKTLSN